MQRYFTRRVFHNCTLSYADRLKILELESLELRRLKFDLKMYFQIIHGLVDLDRAKFFTLLPQTHGTRSHDLQLQKPLYQNNYLGNTFASRAISCWNRLPVHVVSATSLVAFKHHLKNVCLNKYLNG